MPPTFKKAKEYDPALANKTLGPPVGLDPQGSRTDAGADDTAADDRQLLISLGLADDEGEATCASAQGSKQLLQQDEMGSGCIAAFYPDSTDDSPTKVLCTRTFDSLRARLEATTLLLQHGQLDNAARDEVQELLLEQQHQIDLLLRGQSSLRGNMNSMRRTTKEAETKTKLLQQELEQQHGAALKDMEGKLEKAIQQVQQLQQAARGRQQQQSASMQQSLEATSHEAAQLRSKAEELQAALGRKEHELHAVQQRLQQLEVQLAREQAANEEQCSGLAAQLKELAADCQAAVADSEAHSAAWEAAQKQIQQLTQQLRETAAAQQDLQEQCGQLQAELRAESDQVRAQQDVAAASQQREADEVQRLEQRCQELAQQLEHALAGKQELQEQMQVLSKLQSDMADKNAGLQQELVAAVQARSELILQSDQAQSRLRELQVKHQQAEAAVVAAKEQQAAADAQQETEQQQQQALQEQYKALQQQQQVLQQQVEQLKADHAATTGQLQQAKAELEGVGAQLQAALQQGKDATAKLEAAEAETQKLQWKVSAMQTEHQKAQRASSESMQQLRKQADDAMAQLSTVQALADKRVAKAEAAAAQEVDIFRQRWRDEFEKRRKLHNQVVELKGNIRVLARIRPMIEKERTSASSDGGSVMAAVRVVSDETVAVMFGAAQREYEFDRVFGPVDGQLQVYEEISGLVISVMDGYNTCIMAYGQTGSGKTYTIEGPADDPGVNSRALAELFKVAADRAADVAYELSASVLEIYNEQIFDLLAGSKDTGDKLDIKEGPSGLFIPNLRIEPVGGPEDVAAVLQKGKQNRSTFATNMNEHSSRSHLVLSIYVTAKQLAKGTTWSSKLHLIDLAGSERVSRSGAEGDRLKEAAAINKSLSALGDVVAALQQRSSHIPYRNSKLTRLLEDSLGGSSKTLLVVNCSPAAENANESKCSLEFAARARKVELGAAVKNAEVASSGGPCSPSSAGRDSPVAAFSLNSRGPSHNGAAGSSNSANSSPRMGSRYSAGSSELRQTISRRAAATSQQREEK